MATKSKYESDSARLRELGYQPDRMTIRERHEALYGPIEGKGLVELVAGGSQKTEGDEFPAPDVQIRHESPQMVEKPSESPSQPRKSASDTQLHAADSRKTHMRGSILHSVEQMPLPTRKQAPERPKRTPDEILYEMREHIAEMRTKNTPYQGREGSKWPSGQPQMQLF